MANGQVPFSVGHARATVSDALGQIIAGARRAAKSRGRLIVSQSYGWNDRRHENFATQDTTTGTHGHANPSPLYLPICNVRPFIWDDTVSLSCAFQFATVTESELTLALRLSIDDLGGNVETKEWGLGLSQEKGEGDTQGTLQIWDPEKGSYTSEDAGLVKYRAMRAPFHSHDVATVTFRPQTRLVLATPANFSGQRCEVRLSCMMQAHGIETYCAPVYGAVWAWSDADG